MNEELFSIILLHYNQMEFIIQAIDSVLFQNYSKIELIIADDSSYEFDEKYLSEYIEKNKNSNLKSWEFQVNSENLGTVKNLNRALEKCTGVYLMFFAADDELYDENTILNFARALYELPEGDFIVSGQCTMYDEKLVKRLNNFVDVTFATALNDQPVVEQYKALMFDNIYAIGATAFKKIVFDMLGVFDERYKIIEDWSFFLRITRSGFRITYIDIYALKHRDGGVSHHNTTEIPPHVMDFFDDLLLIMENEILPYLSVLSDSLKIQMIDKYEGQRNEFQLKSPNKKRKIRIRIIKDNPIIYAKLLFWFLTRNAPIFIRTQSKVVITSGVLWCVLSVIKNLYWFGITGKVLFTGFSELSLYMLLQNFVLIIFLISALCYLILGMLAIASKLNRSYKKYFKG